MAFRSCRRLSFERNRTAEEQKGLSVARWLGSRGRIPGRCLHNQCSNSVRTTHRATAGRHPRSLLIARRTLQRRRSTEPAAARPKTMSSKPPKAPPTPAPTPGPGHGPKLPKLFSKAGRDRSKSVIDPMMQHNAGSPPPPDLSVASSSSSPSAGQLMGESASPPQQQTHTRDRSNRRTSKLKGVLKELKDDRIGQTQTQSQPQPSLGVRDEFDEDTDFFDETPVIVEPAPTPRARGARSERPLSASSSDSHAAVSYFPTSSSHSSTSSAHRLSDMGTRLSGWFSHTFSTSSTDLSLPTILANASAGAATSQGGSGTSPKSRTSGLGILTAARHGKGHLDKAVRYLMDSDSTPDKCADEIWLLGVQHPGYEPPPPQPPSPPQQPSSGRRSSMDVRRSSSIRNSVASLRGATSSPEPSMAKQRDAAAGWPPVFYADFTSRIWCTYRSNYPPIRDHTLAQLELEANGQTQTQSSVSQSPRKWHWMGGEKGWTCDSGWGCMLRTGQSLLANALIHLHLGRGTSSFRLLRILCSC